ncbi:MAG: hypothetical protein OER85_12505 [Gammaproteobacteria bacterium]|nr:hypothetical protein [Gammaproteobacteria bacterium]
MRVRHCLLLLFLVSPAFAVALELTNEDLFFDVHAVTLSISDQVEDGCLPRPDSVLASTAAVLRGDKFRIVDPDEAPPVTPDVQITALGYAADQDCVVFFSISLVKSVTATVPYSESLPDSYQQTPLAVELGVYESLLIGQLEGMQGQLEREAEKGGNEFLLAVERARASVESNWPLLWEAYASATDD